MGGGCFLKDRVFTGNEATSSKSDCSTYYKIKNTPAPTKKKCLGLGWQSVEEEYDPEAEQCCGEGNWGTPTVCGKDLGCCISGGSSGTAKCFDQGSQQCCGVVSEMPVVCSLHGGCPSSFSWACPIAVKHTPAPTKKKCLGSHWQSVVEEYDPEAEQCCGEGTRGTPTVCGKDLGCCVAGGSSGTAKCFDQGSQQCCGVVSELPVVCSLHGGCPSSFSRACPTAVAAIAASNSSSNQ